MNGLDAGQLRFSAIRRAAEEIARGQGDDEIEEAILHHLLTFGRNELTLGELREIVACAFRTATVAAKAH